MSQEEVLSEKVLAFRELQRNELMKPRNAVALTSVARASLNYRALRLTNNWGMHTAFFDALIGIFSEYFGVTGSHIRPLLAING